jgi:uncharacterized protein (DUF1697 family)
MKPLTTHVALLRGINVGGKNLLPMKELVLLFEKAGAVDVATYIQSGNVVFRTPAATLDGFEAEMAAAIETRFGLRVPVVLRTASELSNVLRKNPFLARGAETSALHVAFLAAKPTAEHAARLDPKRSPGDEFELRGCDLYLHLRNGMGKSKLTSDYLDRTLETISTARNWNTVGKLVEMTTTPSSAAAKGSR